MPLTHHICPRQASCPSWLAKLQRLGQRAVAESQRHTYDAHYISRHSSPNRAESLGQGSIFCHGLIVAMAALT